MTADQDPDVQPIPVRQQVADEGNVPGRPSTSAALVIAIILLLGLGLMHVAALYGPSHVPRSVQQSSVQ
jgi:hypothetical protein